MGDYYFGHSDVELKRLIAQSEVLRPITERLLRAAGLQAGMRVLDLGCGAGDVSMLAAELVGSSGRVVGIDRAEAAIGLSRQRADSNGFRNIDFLVATETDLVDYEPFDIVVGRYVLLHQPDPASFVRAAMKRTKPGGAIAFHEIQMMKQFETLPAAPRFDAIATEFMAAIRAGAPNPDAGGRFVSIFAEAGAPFPHLFCERPAGGGAATPILRWAATNLASVRSLTPGSDIVDTDRLEAELAAEVVAARSQILCAEQCCAWATVG